MEKLKLNKERISKLTATELDSLHGGGTANSSDHNFTCCWCTSQTNDDPGCPSVTCSTYGDPNTCPPQK